MRKSKKVVLWLLAVALLCGLCGLVYAKYIQQETLPGTVNVQANLGQITLLEHKAVREDDGSYSLDPSETVTSNSYDLLPGLDIPKDPYVTVSNKTPIGAYVYVEVVSSLTGSAVTYEVDSSWLLLDGVTGVNGGAVYVYTGGTGNALSVTTDFTANILNNNTVTVGQELLNGTTTNLGLTFHASMKQAVEGKTAAEIYKDTTNY